MLFHILSFPFTRNIPNITQRASSRHVSNVRCGENTKEGRGKGDK